MIWIFVPFGSPYGTKMSNADGLSRLPLPESPTSVPSPEDHVFLLKLLDHTPVTAAKIKAWTDKDPVLSRIRKFTLYGWPDSCEETEIKPYLHRQSEISALDGCLLWGSRVIVPTCGQQLILDQLHEAHPGISKMKAIARSFVWWPGMDKQIENCDQQCSKCQEFLHSPPKVAFHPCEWPQKPWSCIHIDHAGLFLGHQYLLVIDAHSKWMEVVIVSSTSSEVTIRKLTEIFSIHGIPDHIISDNGTAFTSIEFKSFTESRGIRHTFTPPYHPSSNGLVERAVQTFKSGICKLEGGTLQDRINKFLLHYRSTPQATTGISPAELLMGRCLKSKISLVHPDISR